MLLVTNPTIPFLFQQPGKLNLKAYSNVTDAIGKINLKDASLLHSKLTKGGSVHAPLATPENMDLGTDYAAVSTLVSPNFISGSPQCCSLFFHFCHYLSLPPSLPTSLSPYLSVWSTATATLLINSWSVSFFIFNLLLITFEYVMYLCLQFVLWFSVEVL